MNLDTLNRYVLAVIGMFAALLYAGGLYASFVGFRARILGSGSSRKGSGRKRAGRGLRNGQKTAQQKLGGGGKDLTVEQEP